MEGSILDVFKAYNQGIDLISEHEASQAQNQPVTLRGPEQQREGLRPFHAAGDTKRSAVFKDVPPNTPFNTNGMKVPIDIKKYDEQGHLVKSHLRVPPGVRDIPTGPYRGDIIETPSEGYRDGGVRKDPVVGTGKKPKGSGRRLYTDENPKDTVGIKFATPADARATVSKVKNINKPFARKIQILTVGEQRAKVMGKDEVVGIFKSAKESLRARNKKFLKRK